jgi:D-alanyl-D-alanine carboxypeptidase
VFDKTAHSIDDPGSIWVVVDKRRPLRPAAYVPPDLVPVRNVRHTNPPVLRPDAASAVRRMFAAARTERAVVLVSTSTYRSYRDQRNVFQQDVTQLGRARADRIDMRPGYSEHQTGWAIDIGTHDGACDFATCMGHTVEGSWLAENAWRFGFLLSYPADRLARTGIAYEPWHYRYLGTALAAELHRTRTQTLEEFFGLPPSPDYH